MYHQKYGVSPRVMSHWIAAAVLGALLPAALSGETSRVLRSAWELYQTTAYRDCLKLLAPVVERDAAAAALSGRAQYGLGDYSAAMSSLERAVRLHPDNAEYHLWLARACGRRAETAFPLVAPRYATRARTHFERAVALDPRNQEALSDLFEYYLRAPGLLGGGTDMAEAMLGKVDRLGPVPAASFRARLAEAKKDWSGAEASFRRAVESAPAEDRADTLLAVADFLARRGRLDEAARTATAAAALAPQAPQTAFHAARILIACERQSGEARALLDRYLKTPARAEWPTHAEAAALRKKLDRSR